jgi:hypothetical protein
MEEDTMRKIAIATVLAVALALPAILAAQSAPGGPTSTKEHQWLHQLAGQWEADLEVFAGPGKPPLKLKSTDNTRQIGGLWILSEGEVTPPGMPYTRALILGYDPQKKKYVATSVDSVSTHIGTYEGTLDAAGKTLTLEGQIPSPFDPSKSATVRETIEARSPDQKVVTTSVQGEDGKWFTLVTVNARRKK